MVGVDAADITIINGGRLRPVVDLQRVAEFGATRAVRAATVAFAGLPFLLLLLAAAEDVDEVLLADRVMTVLEGRCRLEPVDETAFLVVQILLTGIVLFDLV